MSVPILMDSSYPIEGPDISIYQNFTSDQKPAVIDFEKVKASRANIRFVMVKFSEGSWTGYPENVAIDQATRADDRGLHVIPYHYWKYDVPAADQAKRFKAVINKLGFSPRRVMADLEDNKHDDSKPPQRELKNDELPAWTVKALRVARAVREGMDAISQVVGVAPLWYSAEWWQGWWVWLAGRAGMDLAWMKQYSHHCASYTAPYMYLTTGFSMDQTLFWQWTSTPPLSKQIAGFPWPARLDMNYWLKSEAEFYAWVRDEPIIPPPETPPTYTEACEAGIAKLAAWLIENHSHVLERLP